MVVRLVELRQQAQSVVTHETIRPDAGLVLVEALVRGKAGHPDVHARLAHRVMRIGAQEARLAQHVDRELDHVDVMVIARHEPSLVTGA